MENARLTLETGVTTVRDLGASNYADVLMRDRIAHGDAVGPRMFVAGFGLQKVIAPPATAPATPGWLRGRITSLADIPLAIKTQVDSGADVIKMYGSRGTGADTSTLQTFTYDEMKAAADAAHALGKRIAIHSYGASGGRDAVRAGTNTLEHSVDLDDETLALMAQAGHDLRADHRPQPLLRRLPRRLRLHRRPGARARRLPRAQPRDRAPRHQGRA